ncbi:CAP domain-containing protein [Anaerocolumna sp. AGMB13020]|uniref:CAP domain-containing protein n=1 Tax=Anaerocolumna sp. AGMB13020 TaxID=3081750 RepID=UPI002955685C|nr:CAP domain-containing protein [Anaerocolumna sp. AGMB13020]WOO38709.1 CAP domain-containing protein [Anaerocolumna sp. AGMB13020]
MKRFFISTILIVTLMMVSILTPDFNINNASSPKEASAAVVNPIKSLTPTLKAVSRTATTVTLTAGNVSKATGYQIYRAASANGTYKYIGKTTNGTYKDSGLTSTAGYYYKAKAYKKISGENYYSKTSSALAVSPTLRKPVAITASSKTDKVVAVAWSGISGAQKYNVYRAASQNGSYKYVATTNGTSYTDKALTAGKTYYYKVRGIKTLKNVKYYSVYSDIASAKVKESTVTATPTPTGTSDDTNYDSSFASQVLKLVNEERAKVGASPLSISQELVAPANKRAKEIKQSFSHTRPDGTAWSTVLTEYNVSVNAAGENIAYGYNTPEKVMNAWMNSSGHRANILSTNFSHIGIGVYEVSGTVYCTQLFSD